MGLNSYYKKWYLQEFVEIPSVFPPPWDAPSWELGDGRAVMGLFRQDQSAEVLIAAAQGIETRGRFMCSPSENLKHGNVLRSGEMGVFIKLEGDPLQAPAQAMVQVKSFVATVTSRASEEANI